MLQRLWRTDRPLTATGWLSLAALAAALIGLAVDLRIITGAPAWLKPAKFAASIALYVFTLAWIFTFIPAWARTRRIVGWTTSLALLLELVIINLQAWRGTTSHFNVGTVFDGVLWSAMGVAIVAQTLTSVAVAVALWRQPFADRALGWALRLGVAITIVGAFSGGDDGPTDAPPTRRRPRRTADAGRGGPYRRSAGWRPRASGNRLEHRARRPARAALRRPPRAAGRATRGAGPGAEALLRRDSRPPRGVGGRELFRPVHRPVVARTARAIGSRTGCAHHRHARRLGGADSPRRPGVAGQTGSRAPAGRGWHPRRFDH